MSRALAPPNSSFRADRLSQTPIHRVCRCVLAPESDRRPRQTGGHQGPKPKRHALAPLLPFFIALIGNTSAVPWPRQEAVWWTCAGVTGRMRRTAGLYRRGRRADGSDSLRDRGFRGPCWSPCRRRAMLGTLCHENDPCLDRPGPGGGARCMVPASGPAWRRSTRRQSDFEVSLRHHYPLPLQAVRWLARCPCCGVTAPYQRRVRGVACRLCCDRLHGGSLETPAAS